LPVILGVQSEHANPVYLYYLEPEPENRRFRPVTVRPSVAQAAMIGNPVSMPRVIRLVDRYRELAGEGSVQVAQVTEQEIMDAMLIANSNGHIACTQGGECLAGLRRAVQNHTISPNRRAVLDATAHALKFAVFQDKYFTDGFEPEFEVTPRQELRNAPHVIEIPEGIPRPDRGKLEPAEFAEFVAHTARNIAGLLGLAKHG
jgi:threonine synthase